MTSETIEIQVLSSLSQITAQDWDACADPGNDTGAGPAQNPFVTHRFLNALEQSGSVGPGTGWQPKYLTAHLGEQIIGCAPLFAKSHSQGEYVFDHAWADAYQRAGGQYYPKLQIAVPFTPVTGPRFLARPEHHAMAQSALIQGAVQLASDNELSSLHVTFCTAQEAANGTQMGLMHRTGQQFHWQNQGYQTFDDFLASLSSRKRKSIRKERMRAQNFGGEIQVIQGEDLTPEHIDALWHFYQDTGARKWGTPYLTRAFFDQLLGPLRRDIVLFLACQNGQPIAGALNFAGRDTLFGRYWGCVQDHPCLHFELCYYQSIDFAIRNGLHTVEAGAQGEHKLARGYLPVTTHSLHWAADPGFAQAIDQYLTSERAAVEEEIDILTGYGPFRKTRMEDHE